MLRPSEPHLHQDILPKDVWKWNQLEEIVRDTMELYNFHEIRTAIIQSQDLFKTYLNFFADQENYANQLIYNINDKSNLSLRPEGTITVLQSIINQSINEFPARLFYIGPMFRRQNNAQFSQFHQLGAEIIGSDHLLTDNEIILLGIRIFKNLGLVNTKLEISSFGCDKCRPKFLKALSDFVSEHQQQFCKECQYNIKLNPLQIFQCNNNHCENIINQAPNIIEYLCDDCSANLKSIQKLLSNLGVNYHINPYIPSAFNYYNRVIFNFVFEMNKKKYILANGGRYDVLAKSVTGKDLPAIGFSANMELIIQIMEKKNLFVKNEIDFKIVIAPMAKDLDIIVLQIVQELHDIKLHTIINNYDEDYEKMQNTIDSYDSQVIVYITEELIRQGKILIKNIIKSHQEQIMISDLSDYLIRLKKAISIK